MERLPDRPACRPVGRQAGRRLGEAGFAARKKEGIETQGLTDSEAIGKRCGSLRIVAELSETFRFVPFRSVSFRAGPDGSARFRPVAE